MALGDIGQTKEVTVELEQKEQEPLQSNHTAKPGTSGR